MCKVNREINKLLEESYGMSKIINKHMEKILKLLVEQKKERSRTCFYCGLKTETSEGYLICPRCRHKYLTREGVE